MPFARPTLGDLVTRIRGDFTTRLELIADFTSAVLRRSLSGIVSVVWAGAVHMLHGHLDWIAKQVFVLTADYDSLVKYAAAYGVTPEPPTFAVGNVVTTGDTGTPIPAGTAYRKPDGTVYLTTADATISGSTTLSLRAQLAGLAGDAGHDTVLTIETPIAGAASTATVDTSGIGGGTDAEGVEEFRSRFLGILRQPPQGGADHDYVAWARLVPGVTRVWVYPFENGLGTVVVRFMRDLDLSPIPTTPEVAAVQAELESERPITAEVTAVAPTAHTVAFTIHLVPDTSDTRAAVSAELADLIEREAEPGDGVLRGTLLLSQMRTAIGNAGGIADYTMTAPTSDVTPGLGELLTLGPITYF